ncbi:MAG TPA: flagellar hook-basal body complex protein FliE [Armatimonadetes bacterium]|nr:flagellar hook-basal body complex protein FliE [Armatimonadota bacterium]
MRIDSGVMPLAVRQPVAQERAAEALRPLKPLDLSCAQPPERASFGDFLREALGRVNEAQTTADAAVQRVATGEADDLHEAIIALEKADLTLRLTSQVTQRAVEAYKEISRVQI